MSEKHYENFPVASLFLPKALRRPVEIIYSFAREADDFADEGDLSSAERLALLAAFRANLADPTRADAPPLFVELANIIAEHQLPLGSFYDLLDAFSQDVVKKRYADFAELLDYCRRSADPVGRIMLHLYRAATPDNLLLSDQICSSLQIINFLQDVAIDFNMGRIYIPQDELLRFGIDEASFAGANTDESWKKMIQFQIDRARQMMLLGSPLCKKLPGRIGFELRLVVQGGLRILEKLEQADGDMFRRRPKLAAVDWGIMLLRALRR